MYQRTEGDNLKYKSLLDISGYLEDNVPMSTLMKFSRRKEQINIRLLRIKTTKMLIYGFSLYFSRQTPDDSENFTGRNNKIERLFKVFQSIFADLQNCC